ncbi:hypothetical protein [uncultured Microbulbifer sp.]|nr:hypothetical protein [uncultured Microbulbifer sp.]
MKRYAAFSGTYNLMIGGAKDFQESVETLKEAKEKAAQIAKEECFKYLVQIFDKKLTNLLLIALWTAYSRKALSPNKPWRATLWVH